MIEKSLRKRDGIYSPWIWGLFAAVIFACLYLFFTRISPLYIHDLDDWVYVYNFRRPLPSVKELNPIKVLPETWMPMVSYLGTYLVYPFVGDIFTAWAMTYAAFLSLVITVYILSAVGLLSRWFHIENWTLRMLYCGIFLLAHFVPFLQENRMSDHLFLARDITCIFNYTIPTLINLIFWMYFFDQDSQWKSLSPEKTGYLWLGLYLSIFSSLFQSIVLMSLFGIQLLFALIGSIRENIHQKKTWIDMTLIQDYIKLHYPKLLALVIWFISMGFQLGGRAKDISGPMQMNMILAALWKILTQKLNPYFCMAVLMINFLAVTLAIYRYFRGEGVIFLIQWAKILGSILLTLVYLMLVTAKLSAEYFLRPDLSTNWLTLVLFMTAFSLAYLIKRIPKANLLLFAVLCCLAVAVVPRAGNYMVYNTSGLPNTVVKAIDDDILSQVRSAEDKGLTAVDVYLPESLSDKEWPLDVNLTSQRIGEALFHHGIIKQKIEVKVVPSPEKDLEFNIE